MNLSKKGLALTLAALVGFLLPPILWGLVLTGAQYSPIVIVYFNGQTKDGLTATMDSEEFKQCFMEDFSETTFELQINVHADPPNFYWGMVNNGVWVDLGIWSKPLLFGSIRIEDVEEIGNRIVEVLSNRWYTERAESSMLIGDTFGSYFWVISVIVSWCIILALSVLCLASWSFIKNPTKNMEAINKKPTQRHKLPAYDYATVYKPLPNMTVTNITQAMPYCATVIWTELVSHGCTRVKGVLRIVGCGWPSYWVYSSPKPSKSPPSPK